jgi:hypothetical protein
VEKPKTATLDTNVADSAPLAELARSRGVSVSLVTVTERELEGSDIRPVPAGQVLETAVFGESRWGSAVLASDLEATHFEQVLSIISNGSFPRPGAREALSHGQRRQLRDAMVLMAHVREHRDVFVSNDARGFICDGRRERLEALLGTRILTAAEFTALLTSR